MRLAQQRVLVVTLEEKGGGGGGKENHPVPSSCTVVSLVLFGKEKNWLLGQTFPPSMSFFLFFFPACPNMSLPATKHVWLPEANYY